MQVFLHICAIFLIIAFYEGFFSALALLPLFRVLCFARLLHFCTLHAIGLAVTDDEELTVDESFNA